MKIAKQMLMHLGTLYEKSDTRRACSDSFTLHLEFQFVFAASKTFTVRLFLIKLHPPGVFDIARIPQNCRNVLTTPNSP